MKKSQCPVPGTTPYPPSSLESGKGAPSLFLGMQAIEGHSEVHPVTEPIFLFHCRSQDRCERTNFLESPRHPTTASWGYGAPLGAGYSPLVRTLSLQGSPAGWGARDPRNASRSRSSPRPRGEGYALPAGRQRAVDPMGSEWAEGAPPGWGRIAPGLAPAARVAVRGAPGEVGGAGGALFGLRARWGAGGRASPRARLGTCR